jgi:L-fuculose-phosphate aldolase
MIDPSLQLIATAQAMNERNLNRGAAGNVSVRHPNPGHDGFLITPTGMAYDTLTPADIPQMYLDGRHFGRRRPSSEWRMHRDIYATRPHVGAVLHAHSPFATALACVRREIPPFHYMIARFGGTTIRCAAYASFGTQELSDAMLLALADRSACLLANHGMVVLAADLAAVLEHAIEFEALCEQYWRACQLGNPTLLSDAEMADVTLRFADYGKQT